MQPGFIFLFKFADMERQAEIFLDKSGIKATPNRILVLRTLLKSQSPVGLSELEEALPTMEKSSIFRVLNLFMARHVVHAIEDGRGLAKYEVCMSTGDGHDDDLHPHFYCERCRRVTCLRNIEIPPVELPEGYAMHSLNYMIKGICPECGSRR